MFWSLRHLIGWIVVALGSRKDLVLENLATTLSPTSQTPPPSIICESQAVLGSSMPILVGMENASSPGHATNRGGVASRWLSPVLELAPQSGAARRPKAVEPGGSGADLSFGCGEPARFDRFLDSVACIIATQWQRKRAALLYGQRHCVTVIEDFCFVRLGTPWTCPAAPRASRKFEDLEQRTIALSCAGF
jgi:hypothetical protein